MDDKSSNEARESSTPVATPRNDVAFHPGKGTPSPPGIVERVVGDDSDGNETDEAATSPS